LAKVPCYDHNFYWVGYKDSLPGKHIQEEMCIEGKQAYWVSGFDADQFFVTLAQKLGCFPPNIIGKPFSHVKELLDTLVTEYPIPGQDGKFSPTEQTRLQIDRAIKRYEEGEIPAISEEAEEEERITRLEMQANDLLISGEYQKIIDMLPEDPAEITRDLIEPAAWAYVLDGNSLSEQALTKSDEQADELFQLAGEKYQKALEIKPDFHEALNNWGYVIFDQAETKTGQQAENLYQLAIEKYEQALEIYPDSHHVLNNFGRAISAQAQTKTGQQAENLFQRAIEKFKQALDICPDYYHALNNWGNVLSDKAATKSGQQADELFKHAGEKYQKAIEIKPNYHGAFSNWGNAIIDWAKIKSGKQAVNLNQLAIEKYQQALEIKPDDVDVLHNWGAALLEQAKKKSGSEAEKIFKEAEEKCLESNELERGGSAYNLACIKSLQGELEEARKWLEVCYAVEYLPSLEHMENDTDLDNLRDEEWFKEFLDKVRKESK
jgi:Tfp pilus assembly protein PilF